MGDILIIGGGFAGLEAARFFSRNRKKLGNRRVLVVDAKRTFDFLPVLPDLACGRISKEAATLDLRDYLEGLGVNFEQGEAVGVEPDSREVFLKEGGPLSYEFLIVACGSLTNFYGNADIQRRALKIDSVQDAAMLRNVVETYPSRKILVVGGGYTGIEVASALALLLKRKRVKNYVVNIIERGEDILGALPEWVRDYCRVNLSSLRVNIHVGCYLKEIGEEKVRLSNGLEFEDYLVIWTAGVQTPAFVRGSAFDKDPQGRLVVDSHMRFAPDSFAAGDAACFKYKRKPLRMAVQFSLAQARVAAANILRLIEGKKKLKKYRPLDLGLLVPMANRKACGRVFWLKASGGLAWLSHYAMCIYRSLTFKSRLRLMRDAFLRTW